MTKTNVVWGIRPLSHVLADQPLFVVGDITDAAHAAGSYLLSVPGGVTLTKYLAWEAVDISCIRDLKVWEEQQHERKDTPENNQTPRPPPRGA
jgi:hypothetical protein